MRQRILKEAGIPLSLLQPELKRCIKKPKRQTSKTSSATTKNFDDLVGTYDNSEQTAEVSLSQTVERPPAIASPDIEIIEKPVEVERKYLTLRDREKRRSERFRLFYEKDVSAFQHRICQVELNELQCDNDCQTENEQIEAALCYLQYNLAQSIEQYNHDTANVQNIMKYNKQDCDRLRKMSKQPC